MLQQNDKSPYEAIILSRSNSAANQQKLFEPYNKLGRLNAVITGSIGQKRQAEIKDAQIVDVITG